MGKTNEKFLICWIDESGDLCEEHDTFEQAETHATDLVMNDDIEHTGVFIYKVTQKFSIKPLKVETKTSNVGGNKKKW